LKAGSVTFTRFEVFENNTSLGQLDDFDRPPRRTMAQPIDDTHFHGRMCLTSLASASKHMAHQQKEAE